MHPQTLRLYERRGLVQPQRTAKNTRRYSQRDVERLRRIQELTDLGLNLAGVERVLSMEQQLLTMARHLEALQDRAGAAPAAPRAIRAAWCRVLARPDLVHIPRRRRRA